MTSIGELPHDRDSAMSVLFVTQWERLVRLAVLLVDDRESAEEVVQEAFTATYARWPRLRDTQAVLGYLQTAVANGGRSRLRRRGVARRRTQALHVVPAPSAAEVAESRAETRAVQDAIAQLPARQRQVLVLRYYLELSEAEIAETLHISRGAVKAYASRGLSSVEAAMVGGHGR